jgi:hypothetical protein
MTDQERAAALNVSAYCQDHGALPGERCTPSMRACLRRKQTARASNLQIYKQALEASPGTPSRPGEGGGSGRRTSSPHARQLLIGPAAGRRESCHRGPEG